MKLRTSYLLNILPAAVIVLVVISTTIFWLRFSCLNARHFIRGPYSELRLSPSGLVDDLELVEIPMHAKLLSYGSGDLYRLKDGRTVRRFRKGLVGDPNLVNLSSLYLRLDSDLMRQSLGLIKNFEQIDRRGSFDQRLSMDVYSNVQERESIQNPQTGKWKTIYTNIWHAVYFDSKLGLIVNCDIIRDKTSDKSKWTKIIHSYAGPEGISQNPDKTIGRFTNLLRHNEYWRGIVFDKTLKQFFKIDFQEQTVTKGPQLDFLPIQFGSIGKNTLNVYGPSFTAPHRPLTEKELADDSQRKRSREKMTRDGRKVKSVPLLENMTLSYKADFTAVLDTYGGICILDTNTLKVSEPVASLPRRDSSCPNNMFAYSAVPFFIGDQYKGLVVGAVGADLLRPYLGGTVTRDKRKETNTQELWKVIGGWPGLTICKFILESLQPVAFNIIACVFAPDFDAAEDPRSLFIQPDSVIGMIGRSYDIEGLETFFLAFAAISPALIISILLAGWVAKDAKRLGLTKTARSLWTIGTIGFGLSALVAYLLTKPRQTMVTCQNCGLLRRPDMDLCHQCHAKWNIPDIAPPAWRVLDQSAQPDESQPEIPPQPNSSKLLD